MKKILPTALLASLLLLSNCSDNNNSNQTSSPLNSVTVERGPILGAIVLDAEGQQAIQEDNTSASYVFLTPPVYPISAFGGYIDVNRNGIIDSGEVKNTIVLEAEDGPVLTLLTSMLRVDKNATSFYLDDLGLNSNLTPGEDINVSALSDSVYQYLIQNNIANVEDINISNMEQLRERIQARIYEYSQNELNATEQEKILILELEMETLDDDEAEEANEKIKGQEHAAEVISNLDHLDDEQKAHIIEMILKNSDKHEKVESEDKVKSKDDDDDDSDNDDDDSDDDDNQTTDINSTNL